MAKTKKAPVTAMCCSPVIEAPLSETEADELAPRARRARRPGAPTTAVASSPPQDEVCSCDLEAPLGKSQPTVSHHTKVLAEAGLIVGEKRGRWMWWRVDARAPRRTYAPRSAAELRNRARRTDQSRGTSYL